MNNLIFGYKGEVLAEKYLEKLGYKIIERNYRPKRWGEIDIIAQDKDILVFVEVKTRLNRRYGNPEDAITFYKLRALKRAAIYYVLEKKLKVPQRIDVIAILYSINGFKINHFKNCS